LVKLGRILPNSNQSSSNDQLPLKLCEAENSKKIKMTRFCVATVYLTLFAANKADAQTLSCNVGANMDLNGVVSSCTTSSLRYKDNKPFEDPSGTTCEGNQYACLSGNWAGDFDTAYGCFGGGSEGEIALRSEKRLLRRRVYAVLDRAKRR